MPINNIQAIGDDQRWKREVEKEIEALKRLVAILQSQVNSRSQ
jgi:hypothetical protein